MGHPFLLKNAKLQITTISQTCRFSFFFFFSQKQKGKHSIFASLDVPFMPYFLSDETPKWPPSTLSSWEILHSPLLFTPTLKRVCPCSAPLERLPVTLELTTTVMAAGNPGCHVWAKVLFSFERKTNSASARAFCLWLSSGEDRMSQFICPHHDKVVKIHSMVVIYPGS